MIYIETSSSTSVTASAAVKHFIDSLPIIVTIDRPNYWKWWIIVQKSIIRIDMDGPYLQPSRSFAPLD